MSNTCEINQKSYFIKHEISRLAIAELVNEKTREYLLYFNVFLFKLVNLSKAIFCNQYFRNRLQ